MDLGSYHLLEMLLSQENPVRSSRSLLYFLDFTSWDHNWVGVVQLSPNRAIIVTSSSCAEQF